MARYGNILIKNIYHMLSYVLPDLKQGAYEDVSAEEFDNVHDLFAAILGRGIARLLKQGLCREYEGCREDLSAIRGRIDIQGTMRNIIARKRLASCEYDELSEDNLLNQILKATAMMLIRANDVSEERRDVLRREMRFFSGVGEIDPGAIHWASIRFQRNNQSYRLLIGICRLVLEGMLLTTESGEYRLASFLYEGQMSWLYERFILEYYRKECPELSAAASQIQWVLDDDERDMLPVMQTDVTLTKGGKVLIIDAKYYQKTTQGRFEGARGIHSDNLYQIFSYVKNKELELKKEEEGSSRGSLAGGNNLDMGAGGRVSGMLLYARTDEDVLPNASYSMSGNKICVRTLDLNRDFSEIERQLREIATILG